MCVRYLGVFIIFPIQILCAICIAYDFGDDQIPVLKDSIKDDTDILHDIL